MRAECCLLTIVALAPSVIAGAEMSPGPGDSFHELAMGSYIEDALHSEGAPTSVADMPKLVRRELARIAGEKRFQVAPPGSTVVTTRLDRALYFARRAQDYFIVCYNVISRSTAHGPRIIVIHLRSADYVLPILVAMAPHDRITSVRDIRRAFHRGRLVEYRPTYIDF
jgi:hypothetical protein